MKRYRLAGRLFFAEAILFIGLMVEKVPWEGAVVGAIAALGLSFLAWPVIQEPESSSGDNNGDADSPE